MQGWLSGGPRLVFTSECSDVIAANLRKNNESRVKAPQLQTNFPSMTNMIKSITKVYNVTTTVLFTFCCSVYNTCKVRHFNWKFTSTIMGFKTYQYYPCHHFSTSLPSTSSGRFPIFLFLCSFPPFPNIFLFFLFVCFCSVKRIKHLSYWLLAVI